MGRHWLRGSREPYRMSSERWRMILPSAHQAADTAADTAADCGTYTPSTNRAPPSSRVMTVSPPLSGRQECSRRWAILNTR